MQLRCGGQILYVRFDVTQSDFVLTFEGPWLGFVSCVLVKIECSRFDRETGLVCTKEVGKELYRWVSDDPTERHPRQIRSGSSDAAREIFGEMKGGVAFFLSVSTTRPAPGSGGAMPSSVERGIQQVRCTLGGGR